VRKEQILLLVAAGIGALLVWSATGKYTEVGASVLPEGKDVPTIPTAQLDPDRGIKADALKGRALFAQVRLEKRAPMPDLPAPMALPIFWVRPQTTPGVSAMHWRPYRGPIVLVKGPAKTDKPEEESSGLVPATPENPDAAANEPPPNIDAIVHPGAKPFNPDKQAKLVRVSGEEILCRLEMKGQHDWVILEKWPNVTFKVTQLNPKNGSDIGSNDLTPEMLQGYKTVHLLKTLDNEFMEERIGRGVKDTDREALIKFAQWVFETLPKHSGVDDVPYGLPAVKKAIGELEKAKALQSDITLTKLLGEYYRAAYDLENELRTYTEYMAAGHTNDSAAQVLVGDAYERLGTVAAAAALYEKAALTGDPEARLRVGLVDEREGRLEEAMDTLKAVTGSAGVASRAYTAMARIALSQGNVTEAATYAEQAKKDGSAGAFLVSGAVLYAQGKFADAEKAFATAKVDDIDTVWRSDRAMSLVGKGEFEEAQKEFQACLETDPMNLLDPLFGLGDSFQRRADLVQRSNDQFEIALLRSPDNPWILLRVGTTRLRDNQPEKALALALHLLDVAPGCDEGLWLAGRAAASLDKPDWDKAVAYLRRAVDKEPDNRDFIHEYARVLLMAGRLDDAMKVLEAATDVKAGTGRSDARLLALLAWARFLGKRPIVDVFEAIERGRRNQPDDATKEWLTNVRKIMDDWDRTRIWVDNFDRQPSSTVGNGWSEADQANGINIGLDGSHAVFSCTTVKQAAPTRAGATLLDRQEDLGRFKSTETSFKACGGVETIFHMYFPPLTDRAGAAAPAAGGRGGRAGGGFEIGIGCDRTGAMVLWVTGNGQKGGGTAESIVKNADGTVRMWPMDDFHTVKIVRLGDGQKGLFEIWLDDERIPFADGKTTIEVGAFNLSPGKMFALGYLVDADAGAKVEVSVEYVQVTKTNR
jgi:tetratricopeptide (TPR) repeat protein